MFNCAPSFPTSTARDQNDRNSPIHCETRQRVVGSASRARCRSTRRSSPAPSDRSAASTAGSASSSADLRRTALRCLEAARNSRAVLKDVTEYGGNDMRHAGVVQIRQALRSRTQAVCRTAVALYEHLQAAFPTQTESSARELSNVSTSPGSTAVSAGSGELFVSVSVSIMVSTCACACASVCPACCRISCVQSTPCVCFINPRFVLTHC